MRRLQHPKTPRSRSPWTLQQRQRMHTAAMPQGQAAPQQAQATAAMQRRTRMLELQQQTRKRGQTTRLRQPCRLLAALPMLPATRPAWAEPRPALIPAAAAMVAQHSVPRSRPPVRHRPRRCDPLRLVRRRRRRRQPRQWRLQRRQRQPQPPRPRAGLGAKPAAAAPHASIRLAHMCALGSQAHLC